MLRKFLEFSIDKPLLNHMLLVFIILSSVFAYINIPKEIFPPMTMDKIVISGGYSGTSADVLDKMVVKTIEDDLQNVDELDTIESTIKNGSFSIVARLTIVTISSVQKPVKISFLLSTSSNADILKTPLGESMILAIII